MNLFVPRGFLQITGVVLLVFGTLGMSGVFGPTATQSIFGEIWWFDNVQNWTYLFLGVLGFFIVHIFPSAIQRAVVLVFGITGLLCGLYSFGLFSVLLGAHLENPTDSVFHVFLGTWALYTVFGKRKD